MGSPLNGLARAESVYFLAKECDFLTKAGEFGFQRGEAGGIIE